MKKCVRCQRILPLTEFWKAKDRPDGLQVYCKDCLRQDEQDRRARRATEVAPPLPTFATRNATREATCRTCGRLLPISAFYEKRRRYRLNPGRSHMCKECSRKRGRERAANPQTAKYQADYRRKKLEAGLCASCSSVRLPHSLSHCAKHWFAATSSNHFGTTKRWQELQKIAEEQGYRCPYTGVELIPCVNMTLDHKNPISRFGNQVYDIGNVWWVSETANRAKQDLTHEEFIALCHTITDRFPPTTTSADATAVK